MSFDNTGSLGVTNPYEDSKEVTAQLFNLLGILPQAFKA